jgi:hypothetical protein
MRLNRYLSEETIIEVRERETVALIKKDCGPYLKEMGKAQKGSFIYRGIKGGVKSGPLPVEKRTPRKDRWPSDVPQEIHEYVDNELKSKFGWKPRSQGTFTSASFMTATEFGIPSIFFPIGKYRYIWAPGIGDFIGELESSGVISYVGKWRIETTISSQEREDRIDDVLKKYTNKNLPKAVMNREEIIFDCKAYYLIDSSEIKLLFELGQVIWG